MSIPLETKFLIVDDYPSIRKMLINQLLELSFKGQIFEANSVDEASEILEAQAGKDDPIDFIISDYNMPEKSGLDLIKFVRGIDELKHIPIVVLTTQNDKATVLGAITEGANHYLLKPWSKDDLKTKLDQVWDKSHG